MKREDLRVGMFATIRIGGKSVLVRVDKINPKNVKITSEDGTRYNAHPALLTESDDSFALGGEASLRMGQVVRFTDDEARGLFVVCGQHSGGYRVARLGGDPRGSYWRGIPAHQLTVVDFELAGV